MSKTNVLPDLLMRTFNQRKNARTLRLTSPDGIAENRYVLIGGIEQWISIRGEDRRNPILLLIHGGPASSYSIFSPLLRSWEKHFTIVQWDQRGAGKTFGKHGREGTGAISFDRLVQDGIEVAQYLLNALQQDKLILLGSSVGSVIGMQMAKRRPELFHAYVGTDQNVGIEGHRLSYRLNLEGLRKARCVKGIRLFEQIGPDPSLWSLEEFDRKNRWMVKVITPAPNMIMDLILPSMLASPIHSFRDILDYFKGMNYSLEQLYDELISFDARKLGTRYELPYFIFQGDTDWVTPVETAQSFFEDIEAPHKEFALVPNAGHLACFARPEPFLELLLHRVLPVIQTSGPPLTGACPIPHVI
ncbi:alpha/beta hydrolase [Paenibacillus aurantius]|uniref:prolyl aminopeptidase n=1 Tax=Paenibacillus aurantius TaxID=2918900 RepID=A0AA96LEL5_9BACL|nr:alpha/beta hydrolase [Paenibacillus aurantius]WNQ10685.1 alpha/beta hydrolase [Paenibacillus aurantius]